jgi:hypothetical protein
MLIAIQLHQIQAASAMPNKGLTVTERLDASERRAVLRNRTLVLPGPLPRPGDPLADVQFSIPPARHAQTPLTPEALRLGTVVVSTLPNIGRHACAAQILGLEERCLERLDEFRLVHVSADEPRFWLEVDHFHPVLRADGFSLHGADDASREAFGRAFGVAVQGERRIAHGLFGLHDGVFLAADVPYDQMAVPDVDGFVARLRRLLPVVTQRRAP